MVRQPAVAGPFYSASPEALKATVAQYLGPASPTQPVRALVSPHAGLMYSGHVAGAVFARATIPRTVILVGPNHTGLGPPVSVYPDGSWQIPGGEVPIDRQLVEQILARCPQAEADLSAHRLEHCLEVQLPFLRYVRADLRIVPIVLATTNPDICRELGDRLAEIIQDRAAEQASMAKPLLLASTDMNHYESDQVTREKDHYAIAAIERLDAEELMTAVRTHRISMCGLAPTATVLHAARALGATRASLIRYATSGETSGDYDRVVGYAGFTID